MFSSSTVVNTTQSLRLASSFFQNTIHRQLILFISLATTPIHKKKNHSVPQNFCASAVIYPAKVKYMKIMSSTTSNSQQYFTDSQVSCNASSFCKQASTIGKFKVVPAEMTCPLIRILINMEALRERFMHCLKMGYGFFYQELEDIYPETEAGYIQTGIDQLATAMIFMVHRRLWYQCGLYDYQSRSVYEKPKSIFTMKKEFPSAVCFLVEQFGYAASIDANRNPVYLHHWDQEKRENFGLARDHILNQQVLEGFLSRLRVIGVPFRSVNNDATTRSLWDSFLIKKHDTSSNAAYEIFQTFPMENYKLPSDIFTAILLCGESTLEPDRSVTFYPPRLARYESSTVVNDVKTHAPNEASEAERAAMPVVPIRVRPPLQQLRTSGSLPHVHLTGVQVKDDTETIWIFGRGNVEKTMTISQLFHPVHAEEVAAFCRSLLRQNKLQDMLSHGNTFFATARSPIITIPVNMAAMQKKFVHIFRKGYTGWIELLSPDDDDDDVDIGLVQEFEEGINELAWIMVETLLEVLQWNAMRYAPELVSRHEHISSPYHLQRELPCGICFLIEQFGFAQTKEIYGNPAYLHCWDGQPFETRQNSWHLETLLGKIRRKGVPFRQIKTDSTTRSLWDSLLVKDATGHGLMYNVYSTFPSQNYELPRDAFLAILLCGESSLEENQSVSFYACRMTRYDRQSVVQHVRSNRTDLDGTSVEKEVYVNGNLSGFHPTGVQQHQDSTQSESIWILGRGGIEQVLTLNCVARDVSDLVLRRFCQSLLRVGP